MDYLADFSATVSLAFRIFPLLKAALLVRSYVKEREGFLDRKKWKDSVRLGPHGTRFHGGWFIALEGETRWKFLWGDGNTQENAGETMHDDPSQGDNIRLELIEEGSHGSEDIFPLATGFAELSTQWEQANSDAWHHVTVYKTALPTKVRRYIKVFEEGQERRDHDLKYLELDRDINQTRGVQQLALLATIFLPLSLAAGVLSMQTRFKDLGTLLYDFFGVVVLLAAIVLIIMILLSLAAVVNERPLHTEDRPKIPIPAANLDGIIEILRTRGHFTHEAWGKCLATLEAVKDDGDAEPGVFPVLDAMEDAFQEVVTDLREISSLSDEAKKDITILLRPESDVRG
ncbi:uncharacterized protein FSUBG_2892 [Fusarium subglutinans]|uniref:Uncharacterized protein n=1 Tax=Gibberella subglutinans TaxID=42677 RepID=A0A8H5Q7L8_GIBSU|nr:uncharacterized protein FSUBG_2892 [Fusarium subglutinans]KAF5610631.1 hypothetical protein FSUBG_2892 [Fusarium subglutinans]